VLVDHANAKRDGIMWRIDLSNLTIDENLTTIRSVEAVRDPHRSRLPCSIFTDDCVNRSGLNDNVYVVVCQDVAESFGDVSKL
jgi:hypothetical protein